jgi:hypothetical protein
METNVMTFLDCPAYMDATASHGAGFPANIQARSLARSTLPGR